jgi:acetyl esterase/lipase
MMGDKNFFGLYRGVGRFLASQGIVAVSINYRLSPGVRHPEHIKDVARAFAWTYRNIDHYGGDRSRMFLAGHSAGAHLVSLLATDERYLKDPDLKLDDKARKSIRGVVAVCGVYRLPDPVEFQFMARRTVNNLVGEPDSGSVARALGPALMLLSTKVNPFALVFGKDEDVQTKASPISHVRKGLPPFLLLNAETEVPGLWRMAEEFVTALQKSGVEVDHQEIKGVTHRTIVKRLHHPSDDAARMVLDFVNKQAARAGSPGTVHRGG